MKNFLVHWFHHKPIWEDVGDAFYASSIIDALWETFYGGDRENTVSRQRKIQLQKCVVCGLIRRNIEIQTFSNPTFPSIMY